MDGSGNLFKRKRVRLDASSYEVVGTTVFVTSTVAARRLAFADPVFATTCIERLQQYSSFKHIGVLAYCFMPDHLHLLLRVDGSTGISAFMHAYKTRTTRDAWEQHLHGQLWQRGFYDHIIRSSHEETRALRYIFENPVRSGLTTSWRDYPYSGSLTYRFDDDSLWDAK